MALRAVRFPSSLTTSSPSLIALTLSALSISNATLFVLELASFAVGGIDSDTGASVIASFVASLFTFLFLGLRTLVRVCRSDDESLALPAAAATAPVSYLELGRRRLRARPRRRLRRWVDGLTGRDRPRALPRTQSGSRLGSGWRVTAKRLGRTRILGVLAGLWVFVALSGIWVLAKGSRCPAIRSTSLGLDNGGGRASSAQIARWRVAVGCRLNWAIVALSVVVCVCACSLLFLEDPSRRKGGDVATLTCVASETSFGTASTEPRKASLPHSLPSISELSSNLSRHSGISYPTPQPVFSSREHEQWLQRRTSRSSQNAIFPSNYREFDGRLDRRLKRSESRLGPLSESETLSLIDDRSLWGTTVSGGGASMYSRSSWTAPDGTRPMYRPQSYRLVSSSSCRSFPRPILRPVSEGVLQERNIPLPPLPLPPPPAWYPHTFDHGRLSADPAIKALSLPDAAASKVDLSGNSPPPPIPIRSRHRTRQTHTTNLSIASVHKSASTAASYPYRKATNTTLPDRLVNSNSPFGSRQSELSIIQRPVNARPLVASSSADHIFGHGSERNQTGRMPRHRHNTWAPNAGANGITSFI